MKNYLRVALFLFVVALISLTAACGTLDDDIDSGEPTPTPPAGVPTIAVVAGDENQPVVGTIGQLVPLKSFGVKIENPRVDDDKLKVDVTIDNSASKDPIRIQA